MKEYHYKKEVITNKDNYYSTCPVPGITSKRKKINGKYETEKFYKIDFYGIKKNAYIISSFGRVFSLINNREIYPRKKNGTGYNIINLQMEDNKSRVFSLHCLVARAFIPKTATDKKLERLFVHHKNWDNDYNCYWNLEWRSKIEISMMHKVQSKELEYIELVKVVCKLLENQIPIVDIFDIIDRQMSKDRISRIKNKKIFTDISCNYNF